jgi:hypothetical protein
VTGACSVGPALCVESTWARTLGTPPTPSGARPACATPTGLPPTSSDTRRMRAKLMGQPPKPSDAGAAGTRSLPAVARVSGADGCAPRPDCVRPAVLAGSGSRPASSPFESARTPRRKWRTGRACPSPWRAASLRSARAPGRAPSKGCAHPVSRVPACAGGSPAAARATSCREHSRRGSRQNAHEGREAQPCEAPRARRASQSAGEVSGPRGRTDHHPGGLLKGEPAPRAPGDARTAGRAQRGRGPQRAAAPGAGEGFRSSRPVRELTEPAHLSRSAAPGAGEGFRNGRRITHPGPANSGPPHETIPEPR